MPQHPTLTFQLAQSQDLEILEMLLGYNEDLKYSQK